MRLAWIWTLLILVGFAAGAQTFERILVPVYGAQGIPGAYGSRWTSELVGRNDGDKYVAVVQGLGGACGTCPMPPAQPHSTFTALASAPNPGGGILLYVDSAGSADVTFNCRIQDVSRQALTWGTEIPVVRERDAFTRTLRLLNIPADDRFRLTLRIYDFDGMNGTQVSVRVLQNDGSIPLGETVVTLRQASLDDRPSPGLPSMIQVGLADVFPTAIVNGTRLRLEIVPITQSLRFWAFVSVTNNETQHVTTITPQ